MRPEPPPPWRSPDRADGALGQTLMRAPSLALCIEMSLTKMFSTMSNSPGYWPREPTLMPWLPLQKSPWTRMSVLFGLKDTQSVYGVVVSKTLSLKAELEGSWV
jgi:hypothetical protein